MIIILSLEPKGSAIEPQPMACCGEDVTRSLQAGLTSESGITSGQRVNLLLFSAIRTSPFFAPLDFWFWRTSKEKDAER